MEAKSDIRTAVRERYGAIAEGSGGCCDTGCCTPAELGYTETEMASIPKEANMGLGCGNPVALGQPKQGETVLDLGSGAGIDAFLAGREVGPEGRVIGVDMTPAMIERARSNASQNGYTNVEFRLGEIESLPVADGTVDLIVSNCVINLSPEKDRVFREAYRVLRPGGRILVSDLVLDRPLPDEIRNSVEAYVGCIAGASLREDYLRLIRDAGFRDVEVVREGRYQTDPVTSVQVRAVKPIT